LNSSKSSALKSKKRWQEIKENPKLLLLPHVCLRGGKTPKETLHNYRKTRLTKLQEAPQLLTRRCCKHSPFDDDSKPQPQISKINHLHKTLNLPQRNCSTINQKRKISQSDDNPLHMDLSKDLNDEQKLLKIDLETKNCSKSIQQDFSQSQKKIHFETKDFATTLSNPLNLNRHSSGI